MMFDLDPDFSNLFFQKEGVSGKDITVRAPLLPHAIAFCLLVLVT